MPNGNWLSLWEFTKKRWPRETRNIVECIHSEQLAYFSGLEWEKARVDVLLREPTLAANRSELVSQQTEQATRNRAEWVLQVKQLIAVELPGRLHRAFATGRYEISARRLIDQERVSLGASDLAALSVDLVAKQLVGSAGAYGEIAIRNAPIGAGSNRPRSALQLRGRRPLPYWSAAEAFAAEWLVENGLPAQGDGKQADLERNVANWLAERGHHPGENTIRTHVRKCLEARTAALAKDHKARN